jgi:hypothetical protein
VVLESLPSVFSRCPRCRFRVLDKGAPLQGRYYATPCACNKRFIDEVFAHLYVIMVEEDVLTGKEPLRSVGSPLIHPGFFMTGPPFLPPDSLVLLSPRVTKSVAQRIVDEVPEVRGVVRSGDFVPGVTDATLTAAPRTYERLAGCDVRAGVFPTEAGPLVIYTQQSRMHIEFPRLKNPKIQSVERHLAEKSPAWCVDACAGAGTLGLCAARHGVRGVVLNDAWFAAAFWSAMNLHVNRMFFRIGEVRMLSTYHAMEEHPIGGEPVRVAEASGEQSITVYQGNLRELWKVLPPVPVCAILDLFDKSDKTSMSQVLEEWRSLVPGEVFIP